MRKFIARDVIGYSEDLSWATFSNPKETIVVVCEQLDGSTIDIETTARGFLISTYGMRMHRAYPALKFLPEHLFNSKALNGKELLQVYGRLLWDTWAAIDGYYPPSYIAKHVMAINDDIYNAHLSRMSEYVTTLHILDFVELISDERAEKAMADAKPTEESIERIYDVHNEVLRDSVKYPNNNLTKSANADILKHGQSMQNLSVRGNVTDIDSNIFRHSIMSGFCRGMNHLRDVMQESRSGAKAQVMTKAQLRDTEYFNRRVQLVASSVKTVIRGHGTHLQSCTGFKTIPFTVSSKHAKNLVGKYHMVNGAMVRFDPNDITLHGKTIELRSVLGCSLRHKGITCGCCMGDLAWSVEPQDNLGHQSTMELCPMISQSVLSTKHEDGSSTLAAIALSNEMAQWFRTNGSGTAIHARTNICNGTRILVPLASIPYLRDLFIDRGLERVNPLHFSAIGRFKVEVPSKQGVICESLNVTMENSNAFFTRAFLEYLTTKEADVKVNESGEFTICLSGWSSGKPMMTYPRKHRNMFDFMVSVSNMFESRNKTNRLADHDDEAGALRAFSDLIYTTFNVNIAHLEILILSTMARDIERFDFNFPELHEDFNFATVDKNIAGNSLSTKLAYEKQPEILIQPASYVQRNRRAALMDWVLN